MFHLPLAKAPGHSVHRRRFVASPNRPSDDYFEACAGMLQSARRQQETIREAARLFAASILADRVVHLFGAGHSRILVEEMWPRYGSFPGFHPIVELSLTFHNVVTGANGQRQAMFLENQAGLAARILRNFKIDQADSALIASSSGCNVVPIEMAELLRQQGVRVVAIVSRRHLEASSSNHPQGKKLTDEADLVLDTGAPSGDACVPIPGWDTPVAPGSTVGGCLLINAIKAEVAAELSQAGLQLPVLTAGCVAGASRQRELFESAYDEHGRRLAQLLDQTHDS